MSFELVDLFENVGVELRVYQLGDQKKYWLRSGVALLEFDEDSLWHLYTLLVNFYEEKSL